MERARRWTEPQGIAPTGTGPDSTQNRVRAFHARPDSTGAKRYVGRSSRRPARPIPSAPPAREPVGLPVRPVSPPPQKERPNEMRGLARQERIFPWSLRLVTSVSLLCGLLVLLRLPGLLVSPVADQSGSESTFSASADLLAGRIGVSLDPVRFFPPTAPWHGAAPVSPSAGLPLYTWLLALVLHLPVGEWIGKVLSILFSIGAGLALFATVRRVAGARAGLYALLLFALVPASVVAGQQVSPASLLLASKALAILMLVRWRLSLTVARPVGSSFEMGLAIAAGSLSALLDPGAILLLLPAAYIVIMSVSGARSGSSTWHASPFSVSGWREAWARSPHKGRFAGYVCAVAGAALLWWLFSSSQTDLALAAGDGGGGAGPVVAALFSGGTYVQVVGTAVERVLTVGGLVLLAAGVLKGARSPLPLLFHFWLGGELVHVLLDAARLARHDDAITPLLLPACGLVGIGAAWAGSLPARVWAALTEQKREPDSQYATSPHTAWLLDLPEEKLEELQLQPRPQAQPALGKSIAKRSQRAASRFRRAGLMALGHVAVLSGFLMIGLASWHTASADVQMTEQAITFRTIGQDVAANTAPDSRLVIVGPAAPSLFYAAQRTGWALTNDDFSVATVEALQRQGADYLLSADQEWLGKQPEYPGVLANYSVKRLTRDFILFDLNTPPAASDRLYFLESGHTLGGEFRRFWEQHGGVQRLGYPVSEEIEEPNPLDGQVRKIQYFERAVLEYHPEFANTPNDVMLAAVGSWVTKGRDFPTVAPFENTEDSVYFPKTGHSLNAEFLRYWEHEGGLPQFGYPISEELPEISPVDGKVYTVQYFQRARFEWHPGDVGHEVQLGLIGKEAMEMHK